MKRLRTKFAALVRSTAGATVIEYALIAGIICIAVVAGASMLGSSANASFTRVDEQVWNN